MRQVLETRSTPPSDLLAKINFVKNLRNKHLVKIESLMEEPHSVQILYEHVHSKTVISSNQISSIVISQLQNLTRYLSNIGVRISLKK